MLSKLFKGSLLSAGLAGAMCLTAPKAVAEDAAINNGAIAFSFSVDVTTNYFFRGFEQEDGGLIIQPGFGASTEVAEGIVVYVGTWQSIHGAQTGEDGAGPGAWYESDFYTGVTLDLIENLTFDVSYVLYMYPSGSLDEIHELDLFAGYDASSLLEGLGFGVLVAIEVENENGDDLTYGELSAEWGTDIVEGGDYPVSLALAAILGLGLDDYFGDEFFGFIQFNVGASTPLTFIPADYGAWEAAATLSFIILNDDDDAGLEDLAGDSFAVFFTFGVAAEY